MIQNLWLDGVCNPVRNVQFKLKKGMNVWTGLQTQSNHREVKMIKNFTILNVMLSLSKHGSGHGLEPCFDKLSMTLRVALFLILFTPQNLHAAMTHGSDHPQIFHSFTLDSDIGEGNGGLSGAIDLNGWIGTDENRLWLKNQTKAYKDYDTKTEFQALYGKNIAQFWDAQIGVRHDINTDFSSHSVDYLTIGMEGLAPYFFETEAQVFVSNQGNYSAHLKQEVDLFITQKLITQPYFEADFFAQDVAQLEVASGLSEVEVGALTRYEITRNFAPYFALRYNRKTFGTEEIAKKNHDRISDFITSIGLRLRF